MLFESIHQPFHPLAEAIEGPMKGSGPACVLLARHGEAHAVAPEVVADRATAGGFVVNEATRPAFGAPAPAPFHDPAFPQGFEGHGVVPWPRGEAQRQQSQQREAGRRPSASASGLPVGAPAAGWCARTMVPSTEWLSQSSGSAASARWWTAAKRRAQMPAVRQREKQLAMVGQRPYRSGRSRHGAPGRMIHRMPLRRRRWSAAGRPV